MKNFLPCLLLLLCIFTTYSNATPISLVWQVDRQKMWEEDWIMELLTGIDVNVVDDGKYEKFIDNSIVVIHAWQNFKICNKYFKKLHKLNYKFGVILLSDERYIASTDFYKYAAFVVRNYWHKDFSKHKNVSIFPLGYKTGFWQNEPITIKPAAERDFTWSFAGQISKKPTREGMIESLKKFPNYSVYETFAWSDPNALGVLDYRNMLLESIFVPCPAGWVNRDSYRLYEALECGCIPIVERGPDNYFTNYFGPHPFITVDSWDQVPGFMSDLLANPNLLEERRIQCYDWWQTHKKMLKVRWTNIINISFRK